MADPIEMLRAFSPNAQNFISAGQAGSNLMTQGLQRDLLGEQIAQQQMQTETLQNQQNINNTVGRLQELERQISFGATPDQLAGTLQGYISESQARGGNPVDSMQALQALQQGGVEGLSGVLGQAKQVFQQQGLIQAPKPVTRESAFAKIDPSKYTPESVAAFEQTGRFSELMPVTPEDADPEYIKELRGELRKDVGGLQSQAQTLKTNFGKLQNLAEEMRLGNRSAVAQGLVALVKLGDPGSVVKEEELKQALGAQSPVAAVGDLLRGKGVGEGVTNSIIQSLDPLNPDAVNVDQVLGTAEAMLKPNVDAITTAYTTARNRAGEQLTSGGVRSIFGSERDNLFGELGSLTFGAQSPVQPQAPAQPQSFTSAGGIQFTVE